MYSGLIYCYCNKTNGKCYVGLTTREGARKIEHLRDALVKGSQRLFHRAIRKYGIDDFEYTVLEQVSNESKEALYLKLEALETRFIAEFDSYNKGYNNTLGGEGAKAAIHSEEEKLAKSIRQGRPILRYTKEGVFMKEYLSSGIAAKDVIHKSKTSEIAIEIAKVCNNRRPSAYNCLWKYK